MSIAKLNETGLKDAIMSLVDVQKSLIRMENHAEQKMSEAEIELNNIRKIRGFVEIQLGEARTRLQAIQTARGQK
jgi:hypothetical protein